MSKEISFTINVEDAALQQLLKDLGALVIQHDKLVKSQDATAKSNTLLVQAQEKLNQVQKRVWQQGQQTQAQMQAQGEATDEAALAFEALNQQMELATGKLEGLQTATDQVASAQEAANALGTVANAIGQVEQISEARLHNELARIDEKRQAEIDAVNASLFTEEDKQRRLSDINARYDKQTEAKQKAAAKRSKALAIGKTIIAGAQAAVQGIAQFGPPPSPPGIAALAAAATTTAVQLAMIAKQQFAQGGIIPFATGGMVQGPPHSQGGVPFVAGGQPMEAEGGELVVNRNIWRRPDFVKSISEMNAITGGKRFFAAGGVVPPAYAAQPTAPPALDADALIRGLRGVIAEEVGSLRIVNNVVDTTSQQQRLLNIQTEANF